MRAVRVPLPVRRDMLSDGVLALVMTAIAVASVFTVDESVAYDYPPADWRLVLLAVGAGAPIAIRRMFPYSALLLSVAAITPIMALRWNEGVTPLCTLALLYSVAVYRPLRIAIAGLLTVLGMFTFFALIGAPFFDDAAGILSSVVFCVPWAIGLSVRRQRLLREQALTKAVAAERELAAAEERAIFAERLRIARELHDIVSHTLSIIAVQSGVAHHLQESAPERVGPALEAIESASRTALDDLRRMLGVLREAPGDGADTDASQVPAPSPDLRSLERLVTMHRELHGPVALTVSAAEELLPASVRLTVYRIVQEALTNARKHAPGSPVRVDVSHGAGGVAVLVHNEAATPLSAAPAAPTSGFGLVGMHERVGLFGGELEAGATADGGFRVRALLPDGIRGESFAT